MLVKVESGTMVQESNANESATFGPKKVGNI